MGKTRYPILGWVVWQIGSRVVKRKLAQPRVKVGAAAVVALALAAAPGIRPRRRFPLLRRSRPERVPSQPPRARLLILGVVPDSVARFRPPRALCRPCPALRAALHRFPPSGAQRPERSAGWCGRSGRSGRWIASSFPLGCLPGLPLRVLLRGDARTGRRRPHERPADRRRDLRALPARARHRAGRGARGRWRAHDDRGAAGHRQDEPPRRRPNARAGARHAGSARSRLRARAGLLVRRAAPGARSCPAVEHGPGGRHRGRGRARERGVRPRPPRGQRGPCCTGCTAAWQSRRAPAARARRRCHALGRRGVHRRAGLPRPAGRAPSPGDRGGDAAARPRRERGRSSRWWATRRRSCCQSRSATRRTPRPAAATIPPSCARRRPPRAAIPSCSTSCCASWDPTAPPRPSQPSSRASSAVRCLRPSTRMRARSPGPWSFIGDGATLVECAVLARIDGRTNAVEEQMAAVASSTGACRRRPHRFTEVLPATRGRSWRRSTWRPAPAPPSRRATRRRASRGRARRPRPRAP